MTKQTATDAERCVGVGRGGRPERAKTVGMRAIVRAGHQAAPVAASTASAMPARTNHHGTLKPSIRLPAACSTRGMTATQPATPRIAPNVAATAPITAPLATMTSRRCRSVAPIAASIPN